MIPCFVEKLHKAHPALDHAARQKAVPGKPRLLHILDAVHVEHMLRLAGEIDQVRRAALQAIGHFIALNAGADIGITRLGVGGLIELAQCVERGALRLFIVAFGIGEVEHRITRAAEWHAAIHVLQKTRTVIARATTGSLGAGEHDIAGQVLALTAQAVERPGPEARPSEVLVAGVHHDLRRRMIHRIRLHGPDEAHFIRDAADVGDDLTQFHSALATFDEFELGPEQCGVRLDESRAVVLQQLCRRQLAVALCQFRFVIEQLQMTRRTRLKHVDHALRFRWKVRLSRSQRVRRGGTSLMLKQRVQSNATETNGAVAQKPAAGQLTRAFLIEFRSEFHD